MKNREILGARPTHIVQLREPKGQFNHAAVRRTTDPDVVKGFQKDEANNTGAASEVVRLSESGGEVEVAQLLQEFARDRRGVVVSGARTSLTGAVVAREGDVVLDMMPKKKIYPIRKNDRGEHVVTVESGVRVGELDQYLAGEGFMYPPATTLPDATVIGGINTNAAGARSGKYGTTRLWVRGIEGVLSTGEVLDADFGQYRSHRGDGETPGGYYIFKGPAGERRILIGRYRDPEGVRKISAGIFAEDQMDIVRAVTGPEGTLLVMTKATVRVLPKPPTAMAIVPCISEDQAIALISGLRAPDPCKRRTFAPGGFSAAEVIFNKATDLLRDNGKLLPDVKGSAKSLVLVQAEMPDGSFGSLNQLMRISRTLKIPVADLIVALPDENQQAITEMREDVPSLVNARIAEIKRGDPEISKAGSDACVPPEEFGRMHYLYTTSLAGAEIDYASWGHGMEANTHANAMPKNLEQLRAANALLARCDDFVIKKLGGTATGEHAVGDNPRKILATRRLRGEKGMTDAHITKFAWDPAGILNPGKAGIVRQPGLNEGYSRRS